MSEAQEWQVDEVRDLLHRVISMVARHGANPHELRKQAVALRAELKDDGGEGDDK